MTTRNQLLRYLNTAQRPANGSRPSGELWLNFPDLKLGMIDASQNAVDIQAVHPYAATATYAAGDYATAGGIIQRAKAAIAPAAYDATQWDPLVTRSNTDGLYLPLVGGTLTGPLSIHDGRLTVYGSDMVTFDGQTGGLGIARFQNDQHRWYVGVDISGDFVVQDDTAARTPLKVDPLGNITLAGGPVTATQLLTGQANILAQNNAGQAFVGSRQTGGTTPAVAGFWNLNNVLNFGSANASGAPQTGWGSLDSGGNLRVNGMVQAAAGIFQVQPNYYLGRGGDGAWRFVENGTINATIDTGGTITARTNLVATSEVRGNTFMNASGVFYVANNYNYYLQRSLADGAWRFVENGTVNSTLDTGGNLTLRGNVSVAGPGVYYQATGAWFEFGWNGNCNLYVNGGYQGDLALTSWVTNNFATTNWVNQNFATYSWVQGNYLPLTGGNVQNLGISGYLTCLNHCQIGGDGVYYSGSGAQYGWQFFWSSPYMYARMGGSYDQVINYTSDERLKQDIQPTRFDCLQAIRDTPLFEFRWQNLDAPDTPKRVPSDDPDTLIPIGFVAQRQHRVFPASVVTGGSHWSIEMNVMLATLAGAIKQLDERLRQRGM
jgi:hypothetical protein